MGPLKRLIRYLNNRMRYSNFFAKLVGLFVVAVFLPLLLCSFLFINAAVESSAENTAAAVRTNQYQSYAVMDSHFSQLKKYADLLLGVNIGGTGTIIASLASLITFSEYRILYPDGTKRYLAMFTAINFVFLGIMLICAKLFFV